MKLQKNHHTLYIFLLAILLAGCYTQFPNDNKNNVNKKKQSSYFNEYLDSLSPEEKEIYLNKEHLNNIIKVDSKFLYEEGEGYPYPDRTYPVTEYSTVQSYERFIESINEKFSKSNMLNKEAEIIYTLLGENEYHDESWGMPGPGNPPIRKIDIRKRIMIRKTSDFSYEIYYSLSGCGANVFYNLITIYNGKIIENKPIEFWRLQYPC